MYKYFKGHLSDGIMALYTGRIIQFIANSLLGIFLPIYLYIAFDAKIEYVLYWYLIGHLIYGFFLPFGVQFLNKIGLNRSLRISVFLFAAYNVCLVLLDYNFWIFLILATIILTIGRTFFWLPFHTDLAIYTGKEDRGKTLGVLYASSTLLGVVMPFIAGILIARFDYNIVFVISIIIYLFSIIPYFKLPRTSENYSWGYIETFKQYCSRANRKLVLSNMANGAENAVGIIIWPVFIWKLLEGSYVAVGAISSLIVLVTVLVELSVGKYTDVWNKRKMVHWGSLMYAVGWFAKVFVLTSMQIFIVGAYHSFALIFKDTPFDTLNYELLADQGHFVDEYTVLKELAVQFGKVLILGFAVIIALNFGVNWTFALAALASLFINLL